MNMRSERKLTCIVCPKGCALEVRFDSDGGIGDISGHTCKRGKEYAFSECTAPVRTVTTTVAREDSSVVSVKTSAPIPKHLIFEVMEAINSAVAPNDCKIGDTVIENVCNTGIDVVVTSNR